MFNKNKECVDEWLVAVLAPTGMAAYNINGITIHRFFKLPIHHSGNEIFWELNSTNLKEIRLKTKNLKLIIIGCYLIYILCIK